MLRPIDDYFLQYEEPVKSCLQFLREYILRQDSKITETWQYGMPFYRYNKKRFCYLWTHKKYGQPYLGIVEGQRINHPALIREKRAKMKILLIDPAADIPTELIDDILNEAIALYKQGV